ncbi:MAG: hypothetical protein IPN03_17035 [Holophagales bacterium]|nr:hypothetical protein [Holophagales bacterium]
MAWLVAGGLSLLERPREMAETDAPGPAPDPGTLPESWKSNPGALREFSRAETDRRYRLTFGFIDYHGRTHRVSCLVDREAHTAERAGFGYEPEAVNAELNAELTRLVDAEIAARRLGSWFRVEFYGAGGHRWSWNLPEGMGESDSKRALAGIEELKAWLDRELPAHDERIRAGIYKRRGLLLKERTLSIDYERLIRDGTAPLSDCYRALAASGR